MKHQPFRQIIETHGVSWVLASLLAALAQFRMIGRVIGVQYQDSIAATRGVLDGLPHWQVFQSRVFGPWIVDMLTGLTGSFETAHMLYTITAYFLAGLAMLVVAHRHYGAKSAWIGFLSFQALCLILINSRWHYVWDGGELLTFTLFCHFVLAGKDWCWLAGLFALSVLNRESAFFIAAWMVLDPLLTAVLDKSLPRWPMIIAGLACLAAGAALTQFLRTTLLKREIGPDLFGMPELAGRSFHPHIQLNIDYLLDAFLLPTQEFNIVIVILLVLPLPLTVLLFRRLGRRYLSLGLAHGLIVLSLPIVGVLSETRVLFDLTPFMALGFAALCREDEGRPA
ncbi:hypothetical protein IP70_18850 [alpha proteobacterium AAP38]|nr:hypothetical protein IP70_18850 [alpha proteobacterium AAP38]